MNRYEANNTQETRPDKRRVAARAPHAFQLPAEMEETCRTAGTKSNKGKEISIQNIDFCSFDFVERKTQRQQ